MFIAAAAPSFKEKDRDLIKWYIKQIGDLGVEIKFNTAVTDPGTLKDYDYVVVATGSIPHKLRVEGAEKAVEACEYLLGEKQVGDRVIVVGGGLSGCEIALDLHRNGKTPIIVEMKNDLVAVKGVCLANSSYLRDYFEHNEVEVHLESKLVRITDKGAVIADQGRQRNRNRSGQRDFVPSDTNPRPQ